MLVWPMSKFTFPHPVNASAALPQLALAMSMNLRALEQWLSHQPSASAVTYTTSNVTEDRTFDADTVAVAELADIVGTLIADLKAAGILQ